MISERAGSQEYKGKSQYFGVKLERVARGVRTSGAEPTRTVDRFGFGEPWELCLRRLSALAPLEVIAASVFGGPALERLGLVLGFGP